MKITLLLTMLMWFPGCQKPPTLNPAADESFGKPTATEVFNLRSKCAEFGDKIMSRNTIGSALAQDQVSHYDPKTNRCYVELDVHMADLSKWDDYRSRYLYDGQTGEMLAWATYKKGNKTAFVNDGPTLDYDAAVLKIDILMADDRKR
jgi:hypothetical protein